jgi:hypothetical protein
MATSPSSTSVRPGSAATAMAEFWEAPRTSRFSSGPGDRGTPEDQLAAGDDVLQLGAAITERPAGQSRRSWYSRSKALNSGRPGPASATVLP